MCVISTNLKDCQGTWTHSKNKAQKLTKQ
jgi:hypothetical protein